jgi:lysophospholipase L1-like esterase
MEARTWLGWNTTLFSQGLRSLAPDLVVLAYGTNEAADPSYSMSEYRSDLREVLGKLKKAGGDDLACILAGPSDRGWDFKDGTFAIWDRTVPVAQVQREVAQEFDCAFWDWQEAMGGEGSMIGWKYLDPPLGSKDLIHHTPAGYVFMAERFLRALDSLR